MTTPIIVTITIAVDPEKIPVRRRYWIDDFLRGELELAVQRIAAAHPDVPLTLDGDAVLADQPGEVLDVIGERALRGGACDGRTTAEVAQVLGLPRATVEVRLGDGRSGLVLGEDGRWGPRRTA